MNITKDSVVELKYTLTDTEGKVLDTSDGKNPLAYLHGNGNLIPGLEKELDGKAEGEKLNVTVTPEEAYGEADAGLVNTLPLEALKEIPDLAVGIQIQAQTPQGVQILTVTELSDTEATVDGNHPLAGMTLNFDVQVLTIRPATAEELEHGHAHAPGGAQH